MKIDRLSRSSRDFYSFLAEAEEFEVSFVAATQDMDTSTPAGRLMRGMLLEFAQFEREMIAERIRENMLERAKRGLWNGGRLPLGYKSVDKALVIDPGGAALVREIFRRYLAGNSTDTICKEMRERGRKMGRHQVLCVLRNPVYLGKVTWRGEVYDSTHKPIITPKKFNAAKERLRANGLHMGPRATIKRHYTYLLDSMVRCGLCGKHMTTNCGKGRSRRYFYYRCTGQIHGHGCTQKPINAEELDQFVVERILDIALDPKEIEEAAACAAERRDTGQGKLKEQLKLATDDLSEAKRRQANLMDMASAGLVCPENQVRWNADLAKWATVAEKATIRAKALKEELDAVARIADQEIPPRDFLATIVGHLKQTDAAERRQFLRAIVNRVTVSPTSIELQIWPTVRQTVTYGGA